MLLTIGTRTAYTCHSTFLVSNKPITKQHLSYLKHFIHYFNPSLRQSLFRNYRRLGFFSSVTFWHVIYIQIVKFSQELRNLHRQTFISLSPLKINCAIFMVIILTRISVVEQKVGESILQQ